VGAGRAKICLEEVASPEILNGRRVERQHFPSSVFLNVLTAHGAGVVNHQFRRGIGGLLGRLGIVSSMRAKIPPSRAAKRNVMKLI